MRRQGFVPYGPSRAGSESLALIMAEDLAPYGIASNILLPGGATMSGMIPNEIPDAVRAMLLPAEIMGPPVVFLCLRRGDGLTGERIVARDFAAWHQAFRPAQRSGGLVSAPAERSIGPTPDCHTRRRERLPTPPANAILAQA